MGLAGPLSFGLIPAHAGSTYNGVTVSAATTAHPRSRGEHLSPLTIGMMEMGSSPLTRGAPSAQCAVVARCGLIPAHAGSTCAGECGVADRGAHPRSRGEHDFLTVFHRCSPGSSPLTRGAQQVHRQVSAPQGLIPAHAGSTWRAGRNTQAPRAHPRSRGEHTSLVSNDGDGSGSSPLTWGARAEHLQRHGGAGLIPAHAGSTRRGSPLARWTRAHPRSRGEHDQSP